MASLAVDPHIRLAAEPGEYRRERNRLLEAEIELRRAIERVAAGRRALPPPGGPVPAHTAPGPDGETGRLPLAKPRAPSCTSILDSLDGAAREQIPILNVFVRDGDHLRHFDVRSLTARLVFGNQKGTDL